jgi:hypothetical protein
VVVVLTKTIRSFFHHAIPFRILGNTSLPTCYTFEKAKKGKRGGCEHESEGWVGGGEREDVRRTTIQRRGRDN